MRRVTLILTCLALGTSLAAARPAKKKGFEPNIQISTQRENSIPFLNIPLNRQKESYTVNKNGFQVKQSQADWLTGRSTTVGANKKGGIKIQQRSRNAWPF